MFENDSDQILWCNSESVKEGFSNDNIVIFILVNHITLTIKSFTTLGYIISSSYFNNEYTQNFRRYFVRIVGSKNILRSLIQILKKLGRM